jgi:photosystem II stability/assembly factor-like uncharacterized protein
MNTKSHGLLSKHEYQIKKGKNEYYNLKNKRYMSKKYLLLIAVMFSMISVNAQWNNSGPDFGNDKIEQNGNRLYIYNTRLYHSDDNGLTWQVENTPAVTFNDLIFLPNKIMAATNKGIFISNDNGINWLSSNNGISDSLNGLTEFGQYNNRIFVTASSNVFYSDNNGLSWNGSSSNVGYAASICVINGIILVVKNGGVMRSIDNGLTYNFSNSGISGVNPIISKILNYNNVLFCQKSATSEIYKSFDDGLTWQLSNLGLTGSVVSASVLTQVNNKLFFATGNGVFEFNASSNNWAISTVNTNSSPYRIIHYSQNKYFALNLEYNLLSTIDNGNNWLNSANGLRMMGIGTKTANNKLFGFTSIGLYLFDETASTWSRFTAYNYDFGGTLLSSLSTQVFCVSFGAGNKYYIGTNGGVWSSNDNGVTWIQHHVGLPITNVPANYKTVKDLYINGNAIIAATTAGIYRSTDQANTWTQVSTLACNDLQKYGSYLYATGNGVFRSNDNGLTWTAFAGATSGGPFLYITGAGGKIFTSPQASGPTSLTVYADTMATSFTTMTSNIGDAYGYSDFLFLSKFYINTALSLTNLVDMTDNLPCYYASQALGCIETYLTQNTVFGDNLWLGTSGFSTWYRSLADFGFPVGLNNAQTEKLEIKPYPNPANEIIYFNNLTKADHIEIFNNLGQLQRTTLNVDNNGIDISNLAKGFYIYAITDQQHGTRTTGKFIKD